MAYSKGASVENTDYNGFRDRAAKVFSDEIDLTDDTFNYGQSGLTGGVNAGQSVLADQWNNLYNEIVRSANFQGTSIGDIPSGGVTVDDLIEALDNGTTGLDAVLTDIEDNRLQVAAGQLTITANGQKLQSTRTDSWSGKIEHVFSVDFGSWDEARYYFNTNGQIRMALDRTGGTGTGIDASWDNVVDRMETVVFNFEETLSTNTFNGGVPVAIGFYDLTNTAQEIYVLQAGADGGGAYAYGSEFVNITALREEDVLGDPTGILIFRVILNSADGDPITGTTSSFIDEGRAQDGSTIALPPPIYTTLTDLTDGGTVTPDFAGSLIRNSGVTPTCIILQGQTECTATFNATDWAVLVDNSQTGSTITANWEVDSISQGSTTGIGDAARSVLIDSPAFSFVGDEIGEDHVVVVNIDDSISLDTASDTDNFDANHTTRTLDVSLNNPSDPVSTCEITSGSTCGASVTAATWTATPTGVLGNASYEWKVTPQSGVGISPSNLTSFQPGSANSPNFTLTATEGTYPSSVIEVRVTDDEDGSQATDTDSFSTEHSTATMVVSVISEGGVGSCSLSTQSPCTSSSTYSVAVSGGSAPYNYNWTVGSPGTIVSGQNTDSITVETSNSDAGDTSFSVSVTVTDSTAQQSTRNSTGTHNRTTTSLVVGNVNESGSGTCNLSNNNPCTATSAYDVTVSGGLEPYTYNWSVGSNASIVGGQGTNQITVDTSNSNLLNTNFSVSVQVDDAAGNGIVTRNTTGTHVRTADALTTSAITEGGAGNCSLSTSNPCNASHTYSTTPSGGISPYTYDWTVVGATLANGDGTSQITVETDNSAVGSTDYTVSVDVNDSVGSGVINPSNDGDTFNHVRSASALNVSNISEDSSGTCDLIQDGSPCTASSTYSVTVSGNVGGPNYVWGVTSNATITNGQGTNSITVETDDSVEGDEDFIVSLNVTDDLDRGGAETRIFNATHTRTSTNTVTLSDATGFSFALTGSNPANPTTRFTHGSDANIYRETPPPNTPATDIGDWVIDKNDAGFSSGDFEWFATLTSQTGDTGATVGGSTLDAWQPLTSSKNVSLTRSSNGDSTATFDISIREIADTSNIDTAEYTCHVTKEP